MLPATHAGSWYPVGQRLTNMLTTAFDKATLNSQSHGSVKAIVVPHAGYEYCIATAAFAFKSIDPSNYTRVIILGPSHRLYITHCTIADATSFETPYGNIPFDTENAKHLTSNFPKLFKRLDIPTASNEHSLEMECPILKFLFVQKQKEFTVLPIMVGAISDEKAKEVAEALSPIVNDPQTLLVVSSDFSHWGNSFDYTYLPEDSKGTIPDRIEALDREGMRNISTCDVKNFATFIRKTGDTICGEIPIKIAMQAINSKYNVEWPAYSHSSLIKSPRETCVSYAAGIFRVE